jgi:hypothetical protein
MLTRRFGSLSPAVEARLQAADDAQLDAWADRLFDATTVDDVLDG